MAPLIESVPMLMCEGVAEQLNVLAAKCCLPEPVPLPPDGNDSDLLPLPSEKMRFALLDEEEDEGYQSCTDNNDDDTRPMTSTPPDAEEEEEESCDNGGQQPHNARKKKKNSNKKSVRFADECGLPLFTRRTLFFIDCEAKDEGTEDDEESDEMDYSAVAMLPILPLLPISPLLRLFRKISNKTKKEQRSGRLGEKGGRTTSSSSVFSSATHSASSHWSLGFLQPALDPVRFREQLNNEHIALYRVLIIPASSAAVNNRPGGRRSDHVLGTILTNEEFFSTQPENLLMGDKPRQLRCRVFVRFSTDGWHSWTEHEAQRRSTDGRFQFDVELSLSKTKTESSKNKKENSNEKVSVEFCVGMQTEEVVEEEEDQLQTGTVVFQAGGKISDDDTRFLRSRQQKQYHWDTNSGQHFALFHDC